MNNCLKINQSEEDYLESILILSNQLEFVHRIDVAKALNVSQPAVNKAVNLLIGKEYVLEDGKHLRLTDKGKSYAEDVYDKHCTLRAFLHSLGVGEENADQDACQMEHFLSEETVSAIRTYMKKQNTSSK